MTNEFVQSGIKHKETVRCFRLVGVFACALLSYGVFNSLVHAGPTGGEVVGGSGSIGQSGANTTINQASQRMAIDWQSYDVNVDERVQYIQPDSKSLSLNRILSNQGSTIAGQIDANGQVILVNPHGVFFTPTATVNVGGIIASGLNMQPDDFMNGEYILNEVMGAEGKVINSGTINAATGGNVALIGKKVRNDGLIVAKLGSVAMAAGKEAVLTFDQGGLLGVRVSKEILQDELGVEAAVTNSGEIQAEGGRVLMSGSVSQDVFSQAVNTDGIEEARSVVVHDDGSFTLGGGADVVNTGSVNTSTTNSDQNAGRIVLVGENVSSGGDLHADAAQGRGGEIEAHSRRTTIVKDEGIISAKSERDGPGGSIKILGDQVGLFDRARIDARGENGGGRVFVGGDFQGGNSNVPNASKTVVAASVDIFTDANEAGDGGDVIVWADDIAYFYGDIFARGGRRAGDGGFVEISGKAHLIFDGWIDTSSINGSAGTLLLDPTNISILDGEGDSAPDGDTDDEEFHGCPSTGSECFNNGTLGQIFSNYPDLQSGDTTTIFESEIEGLSATTNIILQATNDITINDLDSNELSLDIDNRGSLTVRADSDTDGSGQFSMNSMDTISTRGGSVTIRGSSLTVGHIDTTGRQEHRGGDITLEATNGSIEAQSLTSTGGRGRDSAGLDAGSIDIDASGIINISGEIRAVGGQGDRDGNDGKEGGDGGNVNIFTSGGSVTVRRIDTEGGQADDNQTSAAVNGGNAGTITLVGGAINLSDTVNADGGPRDETGVDGDGSTIILDGAVNLANADISISADGTTRGDICFSNQCNGNGSASSLDAGSGNGNLNLTGRNILFEGDVGGTSRLGALIINSTGDIATENNSVIATTVDVTQSLSFTSGEINTSVSAGTGGDISIRSEDIVINDDLNANGPDSHGVVSLQLSSAGSVTINHTSDFTSEVDLSGSAGLDTLIAANRPNLWAIGSVNIGGGPTDGVNDGMLNGANLEFVDIENVTGNQAVDSFQIQSGGDIDGLIDGGSHATDTSVRDTLSITSPGAIVEMGARASYDVSRVSADNIEEVTATGTGNGVFGNNSTNFWNISATGISIALQQTGAPADEVVDLLNFQTLNGGSAVDNFDISADFSGTVNGGASNDSFNINASGLTITSLEGNAGSDTLSAAAEANYWTVSGDDSGGVYSDIARTTQRVGFTGIENLSGHTGTAALDDFLMGPNGAIEFIDGGAGGTDVLRGRVASTTSNTWSLVGTGGYSIAVTGGGTYVTDFTNINRLLGGDGADTFDVGTNFAGSIEGGPGNDDFNINSTGIQLGTFFGNSGTDTLSGADELNFWWVSGDDTGAVYATETERSTLRNERISFDGIEELIGGSDVDNFAMGSNGIIDLIDGGDSVENVLEARQGVENIWQFDTTTSGSLLQDNPREQYVTRFQQIQGFVGGGAGGEWADFSTASASIDIDVDSYTGFIGVIGSNVQGVDSTLTGANGQSNNWQIRSSETTDPVPPSGSWDGTNDGQINGGLIFVDFNNLVGGDGEDTFQLTATGVFDGEITGGDGNDVLAGRPGLVNTWNIDGEYDGVLEYTIGAATVATSTIFVDVESVQGGNARDTVDVTRTGTIRDIDAENGKNQITVSGTIENDILAGTGSDSITVSGTVSGLIDGGGGPNDTFISTNTADGQRIHIGSVTGAPTPTYQVANMDSVTAQNGTNHTLAMAGANDWMSSDDGNGQINGAIAFTNFAHLEGGSGGDTFNLEHSFASITSRGGGDSVTVHGNLIGDIDSGAGGDTITVNGLAGAIDAGNGADLIIVLGTIQNDILAGADSDIITVGGIVNGLIDGGGGPNDTFTSSNPADGQRIHIGNVGGAPAPTYQLADVDSVTAQNGTNHTLAMAGGNVWNTTADSNGQINGAIDFTNFANLEGWNGVDTFTIDHTFGSISAGDDGDTVTVNVGGNVTGNIDSGAGSDTITVNGSAGTIDAGTDSDDITVSGTVSGVIDGGGGANDTFTSSSTADGQRIHIGIVSGAPTPTYQLANMDSVTALNGTNHTLAMAGGNDWTSSADASGQINGVIDFANFANLEGGSDTDTFTIGHVFTGITTRAGDDTLTINSGANVTGAIASGGGADQITVNGQAGSISAGGGSDTISIGGTVSGLIHGGVGSADTLTLTSSADQIIQLGNTVLGQGETLSVFEIEDLNANPSAPRNELIAEPNTPSTWTIDGDNSGNVDIAGRITDFSDITDITGGNAQDGFTIEGGASSGISGVIDGAGSDDNDSLNITAAGDRTLELGDRTNSNLNAYRIESITANSSTVNTIISDVDAAVRNVWDITQAGEGDINDGVTRTVFANFQHLRGSDVEDRFTVQALGDIESILGGGADDRINVYGRVRGAIDGGSEADTVTIDIAGTVVNGAVGSVTLGAGDDHLQLNQGTIQNNVNGGGGADLLEFNAGQVNGQVFGGDGADTVVVAGATMGPGSGSAIELGNGNDAFEISSGTIQGDVLGNSGDDDFRLLDGTINGDVLGGIGDDEFQDSGTTISGTMDGGLDTDFIVKTEDAPTVTVGDDISGFEGVTALNGNGTLNAQDGVTTDWFITGENQGDVEDSTNEELAFIGFSTLNGGSGQDNFDVTGDGAISGMINGNGDDDRLWIDLEGRSASGQFNFDGGGEPGDVVVIDGPATTYDETYITNQSIAASAARFDQLSYMNGGVNVDVNFRGIGTVEDNIQVDTLTLNSPSSTATIRLGTSQFSINDTVDSANSSLVPVSLPTGVQKAQNISIDASNGADAQFTGNVNVPGQLEIMADTVTQTAGRITAGSLILDSVSQAGIDGSDRLQIAVDRLLVRNHAGSLYLAEQDGLTLQELNHNSGQIDVLAGGNVDAGAMLQSQPGAAAVLGSVNGDIDLSAQAHQLQGPLTLSGAHVALNNAVATDLAGVTAQSLSIVAGGDISDSGAIVVSNGGAGLTQLTTSAGNIVLDNAGNDFDILNIEAANDATVVDANGVVVEDSTAGNNLNVSANAGGGSATLAVGQLSAGAAIQLDAAGGDIQNGSQNSMLTAPQVTMTASEGIGQGAVTFGSGGEGFDITNTAAINTNTDSLSATNTDSGAININNSGAITIDRLQNRGDILLEAAGDITLGFNGDTGGTVSSVPVGAINANYGGNTDDGQYPGNVVIRNNSGTDNVFTESNNFASIDIMAQNLYVSSFDQFGSEVRGMNLRVNNQVTLVAQRSYLNFIGGRPLRPVQTTGDLVSTEGVITLSGQQLIDLESLDEVDPAIFTEVRNYNYEDVAVKLPADQLYTTQDDEEEEDKEEKPKLDS